MPVPVPPVPLENACSVIFENSLYVYTPTAFQRLSLTPGASWEQLPQGESVTGGVCVGSTPQDLNQAGLFIVGGSGTNPSYQGLQKFTYSTGKWEAISPSTPVTQDRRWHGATYINSTDTILIYAGRQDGQRLLSSQTFTVQASAPYEVISYESVAEPAILPILLPWSESEAILVGGDVNNKRVMLFSRETAWRDSGASLADPIPKDANSMKAVLMQGDDGCKSLYLFDMTQSPNTARRVVLLDNQKNPVMNSATINARSGWDSQSGIERGNERRELTMDHWPVYDDTLAPMSTRTNYAVARDPDGMVVFSGGNQEDVLCIFDARENRWQNATLKLEQKELVSEISGPLATSSSSTSTSTASAVAGVTSGGSDWALSPNAILGIVLGSIVGLMALLGLCLFLVRRRRRRQQFIEAGHARRASGVDGNEKADLGFAADFAGQRGHFRGHQQSDSVGSYSSMAILMGRVGQQNKHIKRKPSNGTNRSSASSIFNKEFKKNISKPIPHVSEHPALQPAEDRGVSFAPNTNTNTRPGPPPRPRRSNNGAPDRQRSTRRSSGWNRYWSGGSALNILGFGASKRTTVDSDESSHYSQSHRITQDSATVPPLYVEPKPELSRVNSGSPTVSQYGGKIPLREGISGKIERPVSQASSGYSSGIPASVHDAWDPIAAKKPWGTDRAPSSAYTAGGSSFQNTSLDPSSTSSRHAPTGVSTQPQLAMASTSSDMSWLNLGDYRRS